MEQLSELLEAMPEAMIVVDPDGRIARVNSRAEALFGRPRSELLGLEMDALLCAADRARHQMHRGDVLAQTALRTPEAAVELGALRRDGSEFPIEIRSSVLASPSGVCALSVVRDVSERQRCRRALHDANRLKSEFFAHMSHELRTPLNGVIGFAEFLLEGKSGALNTEQREYVGDILGGGRRLLQLIDEIMELSKVEAGALELYEQSFDLRAAIDEAQSQIAAAAGGKRIGLHLTIDEAVQSVTLDRQRLLQVLGYILANAVKYAEVGREIHISAGPYGDAGLGLRIWDSGAGPASEQLDQLADFPQMDASAIRRFGGTGLDLILAKKIVEAQDGNLTVVGERDGGNSFSIVLPHASATRTVPSFASTGS